MADLTPVPASDIVQGEKLAYTILIKVQDAVKLLWGDNPKEHDLGGIIESIKAYGMQETPLYDATLKGIKAGNGRTYALGVMENQKMPLPKGIGLLSTGEWVMPVTVGTDAESVALAEAYAVDSNNLTMAGGDFSAVDYMRMWDNAKYLKLLVGLGEKGALPVTVDGDNLDMLLNYTAGPKTLDELADEMGEPSEREQWPIIRMQIEPGTQELYTELMQMAPALEVHKKFRMLLDCVDAARLADYPKDDE